MKLKEKVANQIAVEVGPESQIDCKRLELAATEGFEKAREMAKENTFNHLRDREVDWQRCMDLIWFDLFRLGEEEVE